MFDNPGVIARAMIGAVAGFFIGPISLAFLYCGEPPVPMGYLRASVCLAVTLGALICSVAGKRSVPVFWAYFVVAFGAIALIPWWEGKDGSRYPLATAYV